MASYCVAGLQLAVVQCAHLVCWVTGKFASLYALNVVTSES